MKIAMLSPLSWRTPPRHYGPWENVVNLLTEQLVVMGVDVTLFATGDSHTSGELAWVCERPWSEDPSIDPKVWECLHIAEVFERADEFDLIHNQFDFLPLTYSGFTHTPLVTTIHGFSSPAILPVYKKYNGRTYYVAISEADKSPELDYIATVHHGIDLTQFPYREDAGDYLLFFGRIHPHKGVVDAIEVARRTGIRLVIAGIVQDEAYFREQVEPHIDGSTVEYLGSVGPEKRQEVLGGARALLHLIHFDEPFGLSVVEAMACGTPVIAYGRGSMPEIIRDGRTGFIVADVDAAVQAVDGIASLDRRACRDEVEQRFTCQHMARAYLEVYRRILDRRENYRPWGHYDDLLERDDHKIKEIIVKPGGRLSLQKHRRRAEHWIVISGEALVTVGDREIPLGPGRSVDVPRGAVHRIMNPGDIPLVLVEVQMGDYFGEDDIVRLEDDYGRCS
ncbi:alginate biosynthesis protein AlgA [bacterium BMS3Bbin12]|nr:alginate biosynthesis protein AlgA [bacterium BMS3Abin12]GBE48810.1 alginate biosynthesis protein AlgA [bacterium BMS3Bbin12]GBE51200.1 alginate biosynthesis protein AlgA [bacterium BMS3Bbin13]HDJ85570.1 glycosyltransferase [Chromatiales bacterium]